MNQSLKAALLLAGLITLTALAAGRARPAVAQFPPGDQGEQTFHCTQSVATFPVPDGVEHLTVEAHGAQGGSASHTGRGGQGGLTTATLVVTREQVLHVFVGCSPHHHYPWGFGHGGSGGNADNPGPYDGWSGGGGSAVTLADGTPLVVAGGGGGGGGNGGGGGFPPPDDPGGNGGNGGQPAGNGHNGHGEGGGGGGLGGHQPGHDGSHGTHSSFTDAGGGGGGGGGGYHGGDGGHGGGTGSQTEGGGGGGGGGGSSYASPAATGVTFGTSQLNQEDGLVVLRWTPAPPPRAMQVSGSAYIGGEPPLPGTGVEAWVGGTLCGEGSVSLGGTFRLSVRSAGEQAGCGTAGAAVRFTVGGLPAVARPPVVFQPGGHTQTTLSTDGASAPAVPTTPTTRCTPWSGPLELIIPWHNCTG